MGRVIISWYFLFTSLKQPFVFKLPSIYYSYSHISLLSRRCHFPAHFITVMRVSGTGSQAKQLSPHTKPAPQCKYAPFSYGYNNQSQGWENETCSSDKSHLWHAFSKRMYSQLWMCLQKRDVKKKWKHYKQARKCRTEWQWECYHNSRLNNLKKKKRWRKQYINLQFGIWKWSYSGRH